MSGYGGLTHTHRRKTVIRRLLPGLALVASATILLAGCTAGPGGGADELDPMKSPLSEYMNAIYGSQDEDDWAKQSAEIEELVASCMADEGFEYIPVDQSQYTSFSSDDEDRDTEEWVAANGYGMTQSPEQIEEQNKQAEEYVDPNGDYVSSLSESEQAAYYEVLYGPGPDEAEMGEDGSYEYRWEDAGCQGAAQHEVQGDQPYDDETYKPLFDAMNTMYEKVQSHPDTVKLDALWSACMADAGHTYAKKNEPIETISNELNEYYQTAYGEDGMGTPDEKELDALRDKEIEVALADFKCAEKVDYTQKALAVQFEVEREFIADHKAELEALVAEYEQGS